jgi:hypothetical protein
VPAFFSIITVQMAGQMVVVQVPWLVLFLLESEEYESQKQ